MSSHSGAVSPLTLLKPGSESRLIFMTHGIGGRMTDLAPLASHISTTAAIYGVSAPGADGTAGSFDRIEDLAQSYLDVIRKKQPHGPYFLIGYSLGGLAFFEMCRRLCEAREKVALLVMLESYPHAKSLGLGAQVAYGWASFKQRLGEQNRLTNESQASAQDQVEAAPYRWPPELLKKANKAWREYRPSAYAGKVYFVKSAINSGFADDPQAIWSKLAAGCEASTVAGNHTSMVSRHFVELGAVLSRYMEEAIQSE